MDKKLIETLPKVVMAAAWADNQITSEERESVKDLLFKFQQVMVDPDLLDRTSDYVLQSEQSIRLEMYTESPIGEAEREHLVSELREAVWTEEDKALVLSALRSVVEADGEITGEEQAVLDGMRAKIEEVDTGIFGDLGRLLRGAVRRRSEATRNVLDRETYLEDFLKNKVYYVLRRRLDLGEAKLELSDEELRKLGTVGGLMARVAQVDQVVIEAEREKIISLLQSNWGLSQEAAALVVETAIAETDSDFDYLRMTREFVEMTTPAERASLLDVLFAVANADGRISNQEDQEIHNLADYLLLSDNRVEEARLKAGG